MYFNNIFFMKLFEFMKMQPLKTKDGIHGGIGWAQAWIINFWKRLLDVDHACQLLGNLTTFVRDATDNKSLLLKKNLKYASILLFWCSLEAGIKNEFLSIDVDEQNVSFVFLKTGNNVVDQFKLDAPIIKTNTKKIEHEKWGKGECLILELNNNWNCHLTVYAGNPFVQIQTIMVNPGDQNVTLNRLPLYRFKVNLGVNTSKLRFLGTGHTQAFNSAPGSYVYGAVADPESRQGIVAAWLTQDYGTGIVFPQNHNNEAFLQTQTEFGKCLIKPNQQRATDIMVLGFFEDTRLGLETFADQIARNYDIQLRSKKGVYCTWYHQNLTKSGASTEKFIKENSEFVAENLKDYGLGVMQIDDHWQSRLPKDSPHKDKKFKITGPIKVFAEANQNFPLGMAFTANSISSLGLIPGIWFMPFAGNYENPYFDPEIFALNPDGTPFHDSRWSGTCIDSTSPKGEAFLRQRFKRIYDWGYRYFKIDGLHTGMPSYNIYVNSGYNTKETFGEGILYDKNMTYVQAFRKGLNCLREEAPEAFVLGCTTTQNMRSLGAAFGLVNAMRVGPDNDGARWGAWDSLTVGAKYCSTVYFLNGRVWWNDPDPIYVRPENPLSKARWMASWVAVSGSMNTSSMQYKDLTADRLKLLKQSLPVHSLPTRPVDFIESDYPRIWLVKNERMNLVGLFNFNENKDDVIDCNFKHLGLDPQKTYIGFDYWENEFVRPTKDTLNRTLAGGTCKVLCLKEEQNYPQIVSSSRNINQGLTDITEETWNHISQTLSGASEIVAHDTYELRILVPCSEKSWSVEQVKVSHAGVKSEFVQDGPGIRITFTSDTTQSIKYEIKFKPAIISVGQLEDIVATTTKASPFAVELSWNNEKSGTFVVHRQDGKSYEVDMGKLFDSDVKRGESYTYTIQSIKWGQLSKPCTVKVTVPSDIQYPNVPPKPELKLSDVKFLSESTGWGGKVRRNSSIDGKPLTIEHKKYDNGVGVHAISAITLEIPDGYSRFVATVGLDDEVISASASSIKFRIFGIVKNNQQPSILLAESPLLKSGQLIKWYLDAKLDGFQLDRIYLSVEDGGDGISSDHADWVDAGFLKH